MRGEKTVLATLEVLPRLPNRFQPEDGDRVPRGLVGAKVLRFGTVSKDEAATVAPSLEGGGLVIDYIRDGDRFPSRVVLEFNELGMWVAYQGRSVGDAPRDSIRA
jgi:hypothetical protein